MLTNLKSDQENIIKNNESGTQTWREKSVTSFFFVFVDVDGGFWAPLLVVIFSFLISARLFRILGFGWVEEETLSLGKLLVELLVVVLDAAFFSYLANRRSTVSSSSEILKIN